jgi:ssRNA-specific RNase YbeY (16S rRNA maturation enzyme)
MDHEVDQEAERMERREQQLLDRFYRAAPLLEPPS